jgi:hypothetical protein
MIRRRRLAAQLITASSTATRRSPADVVAHLGAMQAQDLGQALWAVGLRSGTDQAGVERALAAGEILRTWPMRGTIHLMAPPDVRWWLRLCARRVVESGALATRMKQLDLTEQDVARAGEWLRAEYTDRRLLTRAQAMAVLERHGLSTEGQRGYHVLAGLAQRGVLCLGPTAGKEQTFALLDDWAPQQRDLAGDEALAELARRYVTGHGPATDRDLATWSGITLGMARTGIAAAGLESVEVEGVTYWTAPEPAPGPARVPAGLLLPGFDEYLLGYQDRAAVIAAENFTKVVPGGNGVFKPMVVLAGGIAGTWSRKVTGAGITLTATLFDPAGSDAGRTWTALERPARAYARFLGVPLVDLQLAWLT